jgi:hypothetical protein
MRANAEETPMSGFNGHAVRQVILGDQTHNVRPGTFAVGGIGASWIEADGPFAGKRVSSPLGGNMLVIEASDPAPPTRPVPVASVARVVGGQRAKKHVPGAKDRG